MQLTQIVATVALFGGAFAKHGCITNNPSWKTYSKADALENLNAHYAAWQVARDTSVPYAYVLGESKVRPPHASVSFPFLRGLLIFSKC